VPVTLLQLATKLVGNPKSGYELTVPGLLWDAAPGKLDSARWEMTQVGPALAPKMPGEPTIFLLEKAPGTKNPFAMGITVGRVDSNDIVVDDNSVSRFHAWFQQDLRTQEWAITDAESRNGTWVERVKLQPKQRVPMTDGARVRFGDVAMTFYLAPKLTALVQTRYQQAK
jgi:hypothetical protein